MYTSTRASKRLPLSALFAALGLLVALHIFHFVPHTVIVALAITVHVVRGTGATLPADVGLPVPEDDSRLDLHVQPVEHLALALLLPPGLRGRRVRAVEAQEAVLRDGREERRGRRHGRDRAREALVPVRHAPVAQVEREQVAAVVRDEGLAAGGRCQRARRGGRRRRCSLFVCAVLDGADAADLGDAREVGHRAPRGARVVPAHIAELGAHQDVLARCGLWRLLKEREGCVPNGLAEIEVVIWQLDMSSVKCGNSGVCREHSTFFARQISPGSSCSLLFRFLGCGPASSGPPPGFRTPSEKARSVSQTESSTSSPAYANVSSFPAKRHSVRRIGSTASREAETVPSAPNFVRRSAPLEVQEYIPLQIAD